MRRARHLAPGLDQQLLAALAHQAARQRVQQQGEAAGHQVYVEEAEHGGRGAVQVRAVDQPQQPLHQHRHEPLGPAQRVEPRYGLGARLMSRNLSRMSRGEMVQTGLAEVGI